MSMSLASERIDQYKNALSLAAITLLKDYLGHESLRTERIYDEEVAMHCLWFDL